MKTRVINILANEANGNILEEIKKAGASCITVYHKSTIIISAICLSDIVSINTFKAPLNDLNIILNNGISIWCSSIHYFNIRTNIMYIYSKDEGEFYEQTL